MAVIDFIVLGALVLGVFIGYKKGLIKQLLTVVGIVVVAMFTAIVAPYVQNWLANTEMAEGTRSAVAMVIAGVLLIVVYSILASLLGRILKRLNIIKALDKILGAVVSVLVVYLVFSVLFALVNDTSEEFLPFIKGLLGEGFQTGFFGTRVFSSENNFFGHWVINDIAEKLIKSFKPAEEPNAWINCLFCLTA